MIIERSARDWRSLDAKLRPFIARRVRSSTDVDDVLQDVFLRMQRSIATLRDEERFGPWIYQVARSAIADHQRAVLRHPVTATGDDLPEATQAHESDGEEEDQAEQELATYVAPFVAMLPSPYREALTLTELEGLTQKDAAAMLGISLSGMKSRVQRGRQHLRQMFEDCCNIALDARGKVVSCELRPDGRLPSCQCR
jgi:RNA polymerase sigma-70 factor (ECF subfamily)